MLNGLKARAGLVSCQGLDCSICYFFAIMSVSYSKKNYHFMLLLLSQIKDQGRGMERISEAVQ